MTSTKPRQLLQVEARERTAKDTPIKVKLPAELLDGLREIQNNIGETLIPVPSIHALIIRAVKHYIEDARGKKWQ